MVIFLKKGCIALLFEQSNLEWRVSEVGLPLLYGAFVEHFLRLKNGGRMPMMLEATLI